MVALREKNHGREAQSPEVAYHAVREDEEETFLMSLISTCKNFACSLAKPWQPPNKTLLFSQVKWRGQDKDGDAFQPQMVEKGNCWEGKTTHIR